MKKFYFLAMLVMALAFTSCDNNTNDNTNEGIVWNVEVAAKGEGVFQLSYPTGALTLEGAASVSATTSNDTVAMLEATLNDAPKFSAIMANPENFTEDQVKLANEVNSMFNVDTLAGTWAVDITGYARYGQIYIVIDQHWPNVTPDSAAVVESAALDTVTECCGKEEDGKCCGKCE